MRESNRIFMPDFKGPLAEQLKGFLEEKRALGFKYTSEAQRLMQIDRLSQELNIPSNTFTQELVDVWNKRTPTESTKTWHSRITISNQLMGYFISHDLPCAKTFIHPAGSLSDSTFIPYIFSCNEIQRIFDSADSLSSSLSSPNRRNVASLLFRVLYSCGLRLNEALSLTIKDVDTESGIITIRAGKGNVDRYVPMTPQLNSRCVLYKNEVLQNRDSSQIFFAAPDGGKYFRSTITYMWNQILRSAGIPKNDNGPRIHDLRHTFAVHCLKKWVDEGKQINSLLPVLSSYMGHVNLGSVNRYLRLTAEVFPDVTHRIENYLGHIIPSGGCADEKD